MITNDEMGYFYPSHPQAFFFWVVGVREVVRHVRSTSKDEFASKRGLTKTPRHDNLFDDPFWLLSIASSMHLTPTKTSKKYQAPEFPTAKRIPSV